MSKSMRNRCANNNFSADNVFDVVVIGGGAAGCIAAWSSRHHGAQRVALLEATHELAQKILVTGGGRCNFTRDMQVSEMVQHYPGSKKFLYSALSQFTPQDALEFFKSFGITPVLEDEKYYSKQKATGVQHALIQAVSTSGVTIFTRHAAVKIAQMNYRPLVQEAPLGLPHEQLWRIETIRPDDTTVPNRPYKTALSETSTKASDVFVTRSVIFACGGASYPQTGSDGRALRLLSDQGIVVHPFKPALAALYCKQTSWMHQLAGISVDPVRLYAGKHTSYGPWLATHKGCSAKAVLDISRWFTREHLTELTIDFLPEITSAFHKKALREPLAQNPDRACALFDQELARLRKLHSQDHLTIDRFYEGLLPERLRRTLIAQVVDKTAAPSSAAGTSLTKAAASDALSALSKVPSSGKSPLRDKAPSPDASTLRDKASLPGGMTSPREHVFLSQMNRDQRCKLVQTFHAMMVQVTGTPDVARATVSTGGVDLKEIAPTTCMVKRLPGLFVCGEMLDLDGVCGGYNLQAAWSTGYVSGKGAASWCESSLTSQGVSGTQE